MRLCLETENRDQIQFSDGAFQMKSWYKLLLIEMDSVRTHSRSPPTQMFKRIYRPSGTVVANGESPSLLTPKFLLHSNVNSPWYENGGV